MMESNTNIIGNKSLFKNIKLTILTLVVLADTYVHENKKPPYSVNMRASCVLWCNVLSGYDLPFMRPRR